MSNEKKVMNILTFDLEEWFHVLDLPATIAQTPWDSLPARAEYGLNLFLDSLSHHEISCTFFILGWIAETHPDLVHKIVAGGHDIASHGYGHDLIYDLGPEKFREDIRRSKVILEDLIGTEINGYRGPGFSITSDNLWAFDIIAEEGFQYDATLFPGTHGHGGISGWPTKPFKLLTLRGLEIEEYPITITKIGPVQLAFSGGGYFRLFPLFTISYLISKINRTGNPVISYFHPRDFDPSSPRLPVSFKRKLKLYVNVSRTHKKLQKLLKTHNFCSIADWRKNIPQPLPVFDIKEEKEKIQ